MGRLSINYAQLKKLVKGWAIPLGIALTLLLIVQLLIVNPRHKSQFEKFITRQNLKVGTKTINGYQQVFYGYENIDTYVTEGEVNHTNPRINKQYITWEEILPGTSNVVIYNILDQSMLRVSHAGNHQRPAIYDGKLAWEDHSDEKSAIRYFDGLRSFTISGNYSLVRPDIHKNYVAYAEQADSWRVRERNIDTNEDRLVIEGDADIAYPLYHGDELLTRQIDELKKF